MTVDWVSPLDNISIVVFQGVCSTVPCAGGIVADVRDDHVEPRVASNRVAAGDYSIRIDSLGPAAETCRYRCVSLRDERARQGAAIAGPARAGRSMLGPFDEA